MGCVEAPLSMMIQGYYGALASSSNSFLEYGRTLLNVGRINVALIQVLYRGSMNGAETEHN